MIPPAGGLDCEVRHLRYRVAPCHGSASTACWRSVACSRPARARPPRCWPARSTSVRARPRRQAGAAGGRGRRAGRRLAAAVRLPRRGQARQRARRAGDRRDGPPGARRRRLDRRLHRLPAAAGRLARDRARRRLRRARLAAAQRRARHGDRARQRARGGARRAALRARPDRHRRLVHLARQGAARRARVLRGARSTAWRWSSRSSRSAAGGWARAAWCTIRRCGARRSARGGGARSARRSSASRRPGCPGPAGNRETFVWLAERGRVGAVGSSRRRSRRSTYEGGNRAHPPARGRDRDGAARADRRRPPRGRRAALQRGRDGEARAEGRATGSSSNATELDGVDLCIVMGGDGTILTALRHYAGTGVPVFAVNFGEVGFLATVDPGRPRRALRPRVRGRVRDDRAADDLGRAAGGQLDGDERRLRAPQAGPPRRRPRLRAGGGGDRPRALRRPGGRHARRARPATTSPTAGR